MNNRKVILALYKDTIKLCQNKGYKLGSCYNVKNNFNINNAIIKSNKMIVNDKKIIENNKKILFIMSHIRQAYKDNKNKHNINIDACIDNGLFLIRNFILNENENEIKFY